MYKENITKSIWEPSIVGNEKKAKADLNTIARPYSLK
jgi:hypothetical protein